MEYMEFIDDNPASIAAEAAQRSLFRSTSFEVERDDERSIVELEAVAGAMGLIDQRYFVDATQSFAIPVQWEKDKPTYYNKLEQLSFEGVFKCYAKVHIGRIIGAGSVRALCMSFDDATLLPFFDKVPEDRLLFVPILAVNSIDQTSELDD